MTDKAREEFEAAFLEEMVSRLGEGFRSSAQMFFVEKEPDGGYSNPIPHTAWWAWQASRASMQEIAEKAFMAGWGISGEGWNAEYPGDAHEKESFITRRDEAFEGFGLLKVKP